MKKKGFALVLAVAMSIAATAAMAAEDSSTKTDFLRTHRAQFSVETGITQGSPSAGAAMSVDGIGGKLSYGGRYDGSNVGVVVDTRTFPVQVCSLIGVPLPLSGVAEPFFDLGAGFIHGGRAVLSIGGGISITPGVKALGNDVVVNVGYSKLQGAFGGVGLKF